MHLDLRAARRGLVHVRVLGLLMAAQVDLALEGAPAQVAGERLEARVLPAVRDEVGRLAEGLPAHLAFVRLFTCNITKRAFTRAFF